MERPTSQDFIKKYEEMERLSRGVATGETPEDSSWMYLYSHIIEEHSGVNIDQLPGSLFRKVAPGVGYTAYAGLCSNLKIQNKALEQSEETKEERVDEDGVYLPYDYPHYVKIPKKCTQKDLVEIMAKALLQIQAEEKKWTGTKTNLKKIVEILDNWFEHDAYGKDEFDHLVTEDDFEEFQSLVVKRARQIRKSI